MALDSVFVEFDGDLPAYYDLSRREPRTFSQTDPREYAYNLTSRDRFGELIRRIAGARLVLLDAETQLQGVKKGLFWWKSSGPAEKKVALARQAYEALTDELDRLKARMGPGGDLHQDFLSNLAKAERRLQYTAELNENRT